ncbi:unnamed protein product [Prunus armeniaca]
MGSCRECLGVMFGYEKWHFPKALPAVEILPWQRGARADTIHGNSVCLCKKPLDWMKNRKSE